MFLKLEEYKRIIQYSAVPSAPLCTWTFLSTALSYGCTDAFSIVIITLLLLLTVAAAYITFRSLYPAYCSRKKRAWAITIFAAALAALTLLINTGTRSLINRENLPAGLSGFIAEIESVEKKRYNSDLIFKTELRPGVHTKGILTYTGNGAINRGTRVAVHKTIRLTDPAKNSYTLRLARRGIHYAGSVNDIDISITLKSEKNWRDRLQDATSRKIAGIFPEPVTALLNALYFGDTSLIDKKTMIHFRDAGTLHILAASGMNIALVASIPMLLLAAAGMGRQKSIVISAMVTGLYLLVTDMPVSLVRAAAMYMFMTAGSLIWRERNPFNSLYLAGTLIILLMPWELFNPGFQLSFGATAGILFFYKMYSRSLGSLPSALKNSLAVTFAAQTAAFPLIYLHMEQFNPAGVITNIFEIPMITLIIMISLACIALSFVSTAAALFFAYPVCLLSKCVFGLNGYISSLKLNFYPENAVIPIAVLIFSALPLINHRFFSRLKAWPIFASCLVSALMLKYGFYETGSKSVPASTAGFRFEQISENVKLVLNLDESDSPVEDTLFLIRKAHPEIKIIEISNSTWNNISVCRLLMNDFIIEECIIGNVESIDAGFTGFLKILQKENIRVTIRPVKGT